MRQYTLPIQGLKNGIHHYEYVVDAEFFTHFEGAPIQNAHFDVSVELDKHDSFFELSFDFEGFATTDCDRCTALIRLPFGGSEKLIVKRTQEEIDEDSDIVFLSPDAHEFNMAQYVYEFICLSMPFNKTYDCDSDNPKPCDTDILRRLGFLDTPSVSEAKTDKKNPFDGLKNIFSDN
ncbi:MAG: YceD family protein [Saprospiraceae bacterium]|nr:YceD family protein [Saprospiraceae bacterium]